MNCPATELNIGSNAVLGTNVFRIESDKICTTLNTESSTILNYNWYNDNRFFPRVVTFESNGGSDIEAQTYTDYTSYVIEPTAPSKSDYTFAGWYTDETLTTAFNFSNGITKNLTLYAKWTSTGDDSGDSSDDNSGDNSSGETLDSQHTIVEFSVNHDDLGAGVVISVPAKVNLVNDGNGNFANSANVSAYGHLGVGLKLKVTAPNTVSLSNNVNTIASNPVGNVTFGTDLVDYWSVDQLYNGTAQGGNNIDARAFSVTAPIEQSGITLGTYNGTVIFDCEIVSAN